jgi:hypothetical protein
MTGSFPFPFTPANTKRAFTDADNKLFPAIPGQTPFERLRNAAPWAAGTYAAYKAIPLAQALDGYLGRAAGTLAGYGGRAAGTLAGLAGGPATLSALTAAAVMNPVATNADETPYYTLDERTGRYVANPALNGALPPGGSLGASRASAAPTPGPANAAAAAPPQQPAPLPYAAADSNTQPSGVMPGAAAAGSPLLQMAKAYMDYHQGQQQGGAGGAAPAQPQPPPPVPQPSAGFFGGSPSTNPNLQDQNPGYTGIGSSGYYDGSQLTAAPQQAGSTSLLQKLISALGGVTNGGPLSPIGNLAPGKFGGY